MLLNIQLQTPLGRIMYMHMYVQAKMKDNNFLESRKTMNKLMFPSCSLDSCQHGHKTKICFMWIIPHNYVHPTTTAEHGRSFPQQRVKYCCNIPCQNLHLFNAHLPQELRTNERNEGACLHSTRNGNPYKQLVSLVFNSISLLQNL